MGNIKTALPEKNTNAMRVLHIEVCLATSHLPKLVTLSLPQGSTLIQAVLASQLINEQEIMQRRFGIYGALKPLDTLLHDYDRVEIYFPLLIDPKTARAQRVKKTRTQDASEGKRWRVNSKK